MSELAVAIGVLWAQFFSCILIAAALAIAWSQFGRPRYALAWAVAFGVNAAQAAENVAALVAAPNLALRLGAYALLMIPAPLFAIGARHRAGWPDRRYRYIGGGVLVLAIVTVGVIVPGLLSYIHPLGLGYCAVGLLDAAIVLRPRSSPRASRTEVAEWAMCGTVALLCVVELIIIGLMAAYDFSGDDPQIGLLYHGLLLVAVPPCVMSSGVAAILLIASDLALQLRRIAARDPLTGLYNRRGFQELAVQAIRRAQRDRQPVSLVVGDIDHFKRINDDHGHLVGDQTLVHVGKCLRAGGHAGDLAGRIGGEEFALLMLDSRGYEAVGAIDRIRTDIAAAPQAGAARTAITVSFGIAEVGTDGPIETMLADALDRADRALYRSKISGRDRVTLAGADPLEPRPVLESLAGD